MALLHMVANPGLSKTRLFRPLQPGSKEKLKIENEDNAAYRYEFFIPAAVWKHSTTRTFMDQLQQIEPNSTVFKGALGAWKNDVEDVHIYVMILKKGDWNPDNVRTGLRDMVADLMAGLAEWRESIQQAFLFTETEIRMNLSFLPDYDTLMARFKEEPPAKPMPKRRRRKP